MRTRSVLTYLVTSALFYAVALGTLAGAQQIGKNLPELLEAKLLWDCSNKDRDPPCLTRMRAVGNVFAREDRLDQAQFWYRQAALQGDAVAMFHLAWVYERRAQTTHRPRAGGLGVWPEYDVKPTRISRQEFFVLTKKWRDRTFAAARDRYSYHLLSESWYRRSADLGFAPSMNNLAMLYARLDHFADHSELARDYLKAAYEAGNPIASWNYVNAYPHEPNLPPIPSDPTQWREWVWTPVDGVERQLARPVLERTHAIAGSISDAEREGFRQSARLGEPVTFRVRPLQPPALASNPEVEQRPEQQ